MIVPFRGADAGLDQVLADLQRLDLGPRDEVIVAHNGRPSGTRELRGRALVVGAAGLRSPAYARNCGAAVASGTWLVFLDADTSPAPDLLAHLFRPTPGPGTGILAGEVEDDPPGGGLVARHARSRQPMRQEIALSGPAARYAQTANCAIRTEAFQAAGGFAARARTGEDADLCLRLQKAGWDLESRPQARVAHRSRHSERARLTQLALHGAGARWVNRRHPGAMPPAAPWPLARRLVRKLRGAVQALRDGEREEAVFRLQDALEAVVFEGGRLLPNRARRER